MANRHTILLLEIHRLRAILMEDRMDYLRKTHIPRIMRILPSYAIPRANQPTSWLSMSDEQRAEWLLQQVVAADPSTNKKYSNWLLNILGRNALPYEDIEKATDYLTRFEHAKATGVVPRSTNVESLKYLADLFVLINQGQDQQVSADKAEEQEALRQSDVIYDGADYLILIPKTEFAACFFGRPTEWCTAWGDPKGRYPTRTNQFNQYHKDGPLYIVIEKGGSRWQFHPASQSFMDASDRAIDVAAFLRNHPKVAEVFDRMGDEAEAIRVKEGWLFPTAGGFTIRTGKGPISRTIIRFYQAGLMAEESRMEYVDSHGRSYQKIDIEQWAAENPEVVRYFEERDLDRTISEGPDGVLYPKEDGAEHGIYLQDRRGMLGKLIFSATFTDDKHVEIGPRNHAAAAMHAYVDYFRRHPELGEKLTTPEPLEEVTSYDGGYIYRMPKGYYAKRHWDARDGGFVIKSMPGRLGIPMHKVHVQEDGTLGFIDGMMPVTDLPAKIMADVLNKEGVKFGGSLQQIEQSGLLYGNGRWGNLREVGTRLLEHDGVTAWQMNDGDGGPIYFLRGRSEIKPFAKLPYPKLQPLVRPVGEGHREAMRHIHPMLVQMIEQGIIKPDSYSSMSSKARGRFRYSSSHDDTSSYSDKELLSRRGIVWAGDKLGWQAISKVKSAKTYAEHDGDRLLGYSSRFYGIGRDGHFLGMVIPTKVVRGIRIEASNITFAARVDIDRLMYLLVALSKKHDMHVAFDEDINYSERTKDSGWAVSNGALRHAGQIQTHDDLGGEFNAKRKATNGGDSIVTVAKGSAPLLLIHLDHNDKLTHIAGAPGRDAFSSTKIAGDDAEGLARALNHFGISVRRDWLLFYGLLFKEDKFQALDGERDKDIISYRDGSYQIDERFIFVRNGGGPRTRTEAERDKTHDGHIDLIDPDYNRSVVSIESPNEHYGLNVKMRKELPVGMGINRADVIAATTKFLHWWHERIEANYVNVPAVCTPDAG